MTAAPLRPAVEVARRCLCFELMLQRLGLETDDDPASERESVRAMWWERLGRLGVEGTLTERERSLLARPVGELTEDDLDDLHGRASGALVLLWALGRFPTRPNLDAVDELGELLARHGLLGDGSVSRAVAEVEAAKLRSNEELEAAHAAYAQKRGKSKELADGEKIVAAVALHHLEWVLDPEMELEGDDES